MSAQLKTFSLFLIIFGLATFFTHTSQTQVLAEDCNLDCLEKQIADLEQKRQLSEAATAPLEGEVERLTAQVKSIGGQIAAAKIELQSLSSSIDTREKDLAGDYQILSVRVAEFYKRSRTQPIMLTLFASKDVSQASKELIYQTRLSNRDRATITTTTEELLSLEDDKARLEAESTQLAALQVRLDEQAKYFQVEIDKARDYQAVLSSQIAELSARQQEILTEKASTFQTSVGNVPLADDPNSQPGYNPGFSPAFAAFSFGAPHFKGMSQYGAFGRAIEGQNFEQILKAYYGDGIEIRDHNPDESITVEGYGTYSLEEYTKRIYEMPGSWGSEGGMEALKAQAIAARSYVLARGGTICATESCQVFKPEPKGGNWEQAVNDTRGKTVYVNGAPFSTWYASTSGGYQESYSSNGYSTPGFWDTKNGRSGWTSEAYEKIGGSPWFYKGWYKSRSGDSCGRSHPWLTSEEMADILNAWVVITKHGQSDDRVTPTGPCWGGNPYSTNELRDRANTLGEGYSSVSSVSVTYRDDGVTDSVTFGTNRGSVSIDGLDFKNIFNLRAPARIALKAGLFNIEAK